MNLRIIKGAVGLSGIVGHFILLQPYTQAWIDFWIGESKSLQNISEWRALFVIWMKSTSGKLFGNHSNRKLNNKTKFTLANLLFAYLHTIFIHAHLELNKTIFGRIMSLNFCNKSHDWGTIIQHVHEISSRCIMSRRPDDCCFFFADKKI